MLTPRETEFYVGAHANPFGVHMRLRTLAGCVEAFARYRLGNLFCCNGNEIGHITGASQQDMILDPANAAVQAGVACARRGLFFMFISVDFADRAVVEYLNEQAGRFFLGPLKGETSGLPASNWHADSPHINESNRHLNHNPPPCFATDMRHAADTYARFVRERFVERYRAQGVRRLIALDQNFLHRFHLEAGFDVPVTELMTQRVQPDLACLRGTAAAFDKPLWGAWIAIGWYGGSNYDPHKPRRWEASLAAAYLHGSRLFVQESGHFGIHEHGDRNTLGPDHPLSRSYRRTLARFYRFTRTHARPQGGPEVPVAFLQGRDDGWTGSRLGHRPPRAWVWGQKDSGDHWLSGDPERGWELLDVAYPLFPAAGENQTDHFSGAPFGQVDLAPADAPADALARYRCLVMPGWNTMTDGQYAALADYVRGGGTLFLGLPQFNTDPDRSHPWQLVRGGDLRELCGVRIGASETREKGYLGSWTGNGARATVVRRSACGLPVGRSFVLHPPQKLVALERHGAAVIAQSQEGHPVLLEHALGRGRVILLAVWAWPGCPAIRPFVSALVRGLLARFGHPMKLRGSPWVDWSEFKWNGTCSNLYFLNANLYGRETGALAVARNLAVPFDLAPGEFAVLYKTGARVFRPDDPMLPLVPVEDRDGTVVFTVSRASLRRRAAGVTYYTPGRSGRVRLDARRLNPTTGLRLVE